MLGILVTCTRSWSGGSRQHGDELQVATQLSLLVSPLRLSLSPILPPRLEYDYHHATQGPIKMVMRFRDMQVGRACG